MKSIRKNNPAKVVLGFLILCFLSSYKINTAEETFAIIVNNSVSEDVMSLKDVKASLEGDKTRWSNKERVVLALMKPETPTGTLIAEKVFGMSASQLNRHFLMLVYQGKITAPKFFTSESELIKFVKTTPGAIGVVHNQSVEDAKVIKWEG